VITVANSSPLINLVRSHSLDILQTLYQRIVIPQQVYEEVVTGGQGLPEADERSIGNWTKNYR
jgi:uncharacterized protein